MPAVRAIEDRPRLVGHCALEAFSVLTRLPPPQRIAGSLVAAFLSNRFLDEPLLLPAARMRTLLSDLLERDVTGGAVYDGLIALTAAEYDVELLTLDRRAEETYRRCG